MSLGEVFFMEKFKIEVRRMLFPLYKHLVIFTLCFPGFPTMKPHQILVPGQALVLMCFHFKIQLRIYLIHGIKE